MPTRRPVVLSTEASLEEDGLSVPFQIVRSPRRQRTISLTLDREGRIRVLAPLGVPDAVLRDFLRRRLPILRRWQAARTDRPPQAPLQTGRTILSLDDELVLQVVAGPAGTRFEPPDRLVLSVPGSLDAGRREAVLRTALESWARQRAAQFFIAAVARWAGVLDVRTPAVLIREQRQRWGSCSPSGVLRFNWRLALAPRSLADYVALHETAHLRHANHSAAYWSLVHACMPDATARRAQLNALAGTLGL